MPVELLERLTPAVGLADNLVLLLERKQLPQFLPTAAAVAFGETATGPAKVPQVLEGVLLVPQLTSQGRLGYKYPTF